MSIRNIGGALGESVGSSLSVRMSSWSPFRPVSTGRISSLLQNMVPTGYTKLLQRGALAMVDLGAKPDSSLIQNGFRQETTHLEGRRVVDRASRSSLSLSDCGDVSYAETEPMLSERRLSAEEENPRSSRRSRQEARWGLLCPKSLYSLWLYRY
ncbi:hypothetical protein WMY93_030849 [Mugilogobius chulae]|uniref:Uncharacterized protein n=1 Tax=Mugilogobius chulae TaxID=88201 RepID=A0AAW0MFZ7_9GOBI